jgi:hypothetical protein
MASRALSSHPMRSLVLALVMLLAGALAGALAPACAVPASFSCVEDEDCGLDQECGDERVCRDKPPALALGEGEGEGAEGEGEGAGEGEGEGEGEGGGEGEGEPCPPIAGATVGVFQQHCYVAFAENESWARGVVRCAALGGYLAVPSSLPEHDLLRSSFVPIGFDPFVGLTDAHDEGTFTSIVGESLPSDLTPFFGGGEPNDGGTFGASEDCIEYLETDDGDDVDPAWNDEQCDAVDEGANVTSTLCELPFATVPGAGVAGTARFCGDGVVQAAFGECAAPPDPGSCAEDCGATFTPDVAYEALDDRVLIGFAVPRSFSSASNACETLGGTLAIPDSEESNDRVTLIVARLAQPSVWIGYHDRFDEVGNNADQFRRADNNDDIGEGFEAFGVGEPNALSSDEDCVESFGANGWNDVDCDDDKAFVCELK